MAPRREGDTNFRPVLGLTRALARRLDETFAPLEPLFREIDSETF